MARYGFPKDGLSLSGRRNKHFSTMQNTQSGLDWALSNFLGMTTYPIISRPAPTYIFVPDICCFDTFGRLHFGCVLTATQPPIDIQAMVNPMIESAIVNKAMGIAQYSLRWRRMLER